MTLRYLDQLGIASTYNTKVYCRQTLIGGNYGLLNTSTLTPNPDYYRQVEIKYYRKIKNQRLIDDFIYFYSLECYLIIYSGKACDCLTYLILDSCSAYSALLWHRLMGKKVLGVSSDISSPFLRTYAHCSKDRVSMLI
jgi:heparanase 1